MFICRKCNIELNDNNWNLSFKKHCQYICKCCEKERKLKYKKPKLLKIIKLKTVLSKIKNLKIKEKIINNYGGKCECCNCDIWQFLSIDHINGGGSQERKITQKSGVLFYKNLIKNNYPKSEFRLLCYNCNSAKGHHGFCYHELNKSINCNFCKTLLTNENIFEINKFYNMNVCKNCVTEKSSKNKVLNKQTLKAKYQSLNYKFEVIQNYNFVCTCCNENNYQALTIDHINNDGNVDRKNNLFGINFYRYLKKQNYPKDNYQLLCHNCNSCKGFYGQCYHKLCKNYDKININISEYKNILYEGNVKV